MREAVTSTPSDGFALSYFCIYVHSISFAPRNLENNEMVEKRDAIAGSTTPNAMPCVKELIPSEPQGFSSDERCRGVRVLSEFDPFHGYPLCFDSHSWGQLTPICFLIFGTPTMVDFSWFRLRHADAFDEDVESPCPKLAV